MYAVTNLIFIFLKIYKVEIVGFGNNNLMTGRINKNIK